jgi:hypothetical protein
MAMPRTDNELMIWLKQFAQTFATHAPALGFTAADVTAVQNDAAMLEYLVSDLLPTYKTALQTRTTYKNLVKDGPLGSTGGSVPAVPTQNAPPASVAPGIVPRVRQLIQRIQAAPNYTEAIGRDLDIVGGNGAETDPTTAKPTAKAVALANSEVRIEFVKGRFDGVVIESRRTGENDWSALGTDNYSPYLDSRPPLDTGKPEVREYRLRYLLRDESVGEWSDVISVSTTR